MRLASVMCIGPGGSQIEVAATGEHGLEMHPRDEFTYITDLNLPPYLANPTAPEPRTVAVMPNTWAFFYEWEHTEPLKS